MDLPRAVRRTTAALFEFVWPSYQPERHYMRGPGPACAKRRQKTGELHGTMPF